jgi:hypothetical protein
MSSDIPGFYFDAALRRYYRISSQPSNIIPSARVINERARHEQLINKQLDAIIPRSKQHSQRKNRAKSRLSLLRQREYGQTSIRKSNQIPKL